MSGTYLNNVKSINNYREKQKKAGLKTLTVTGLDPDVIEMLKEKKGSATWSEYLTRLANES